MQTIEVTDPKQILFKIVQSDTAGERSVMLVSLNPLAGWFLDEGSGNSSRIIFSWDLKSDGYIDDIEDIIGDWQQKNYGRPKYGTTIYDSFRDALGKVEEYAYGGMLSPEMHKLLKLLFTAPRR